MDFLVKNALENMSSETIDNYEVGQARMTVIGCGGAVPAVGLFFARRRSARGVERVRFRGRPMPLGGGAHAAVLAGDSTAHRLRFMARQIRRRCVWLRTKPR